MLAQTAKNHKQKGFSFNRGENDFLLIHQFNHVALHAKTASASPWQGIPRLAELFEGATPQPFFKGPKVPELEELALTETQLLEQTAALLGVSLAQITTLPTEAFKGPSWKPPGFTTKERLSLFLGKTVAKLCILDQAASRSFSANHIFMSD